MERTGARGGVSAGDDRVTPPSMTDSYDDHQIAAPLLTCPVCQRVYYMTSGGPLCGSCRQQQPAKSA